MITQECIEWDGGLTAAFYGRVTINGKRESIHRVVWEAYGPIPNGKLIRHKCDNPPCILLDHLEIGTDADNAKDKMDRGRSGLRPYCCRGHEMSGSNIRFRYRERNNHPERYCLKCARIRNRNYRRRSNL